VVVDWPAHSLLPFGFPATHIPLVICPIPYPQSELAQLTSPVLSVSPLVQFPYQLNELSALAVCPWMTCMLACCRFDSVVSTPSSTCAGRDPPPSIVGRGNSPFGPCGV